MKNPARTAPFGPKRAKKSQRKSARNSTPALGLFVSAALVVALGASRAPAQDINEAVTVEDLGFTQRLLAGTRPAALAGAYTSIGADAHSLVYNPAGLARVRRIETSLGFQHQRRDLDNTFFGTDGRVDLTTTKLDHIAWAYPLPTYRGSLVVAAGVYRVFSHDIDVLNRGFNSNTQTNDDYRLQQSGSTYGYNLGVGVDLSPTLSVGANVFLIDGTIKALTQFSFEFLPPFNPGELERETLVDDVEVDLDGYGAILGFQFHPHRLLHFGLSVSTPIPINLRGDALQDDALYFFNSPDSFVTDTFLIDTDYQIPFRFDAGVSFSASHLLVAADVGYSDWRQTEINGIQLKDQDLRPVFREVVDLRAGIELTVPRTPLRLRGGYAYVPHPLRFLQADRIQGDQIRRARIETERQIVTGGIGVLIGRVLTVDATFQYDVGERAIATLVDRRETRRFLLSASYRL